MASEEQQYLVGDKGVNIVQSPLHTPESGLLVAQNVEFVRQFGLGGIGSRKGITRLNTSALGASVGAVENLPFNFPGELDLMVCLNLAVANGSNSWKRSTDGTTFADLTTSQLQRAVEPVLIGVTTPLAFFPRNMRSVTYRSLSYYAGDNYTAGTGGTAPPLVLWDGTVSYEVLRIPPNPETPVTQQCNCIIDMVALKGLIYIAVWDPSTGSVAPDEKGRVLQFNPADGSLYLVGNPFGGGANQNTGGFPYCLCGHAGYLWAGTNGITGNEVGKVWRILPGVDSTWTLDHSTPLHNGYVGSMASYNGNLYIATSADSGGTAIIQQRDQAGAWTTSFSAPTSNVSRFGGLFVFESKLYVWWNGNAGADTFIYEFDGSSWTKVVDVGVTYLSGAKGGAPTIFRGNLYWPFNTSSDTATTGRLLKKASGGAWSSVLTAGIRQCVARYIPGRS